MTITGAAVEEETASNHGLTEYDLMHNRTIGPSLQPRRPEWTLSVVYRITKAELSGVETVRH